ncbi:hypothetical protein ACFL0T_05905 [Candidatus Omnitrophota bacterium]
MKIYKIGIFVKVLMIIFSVFLFLGSLFMLISPEFSQYIKLMTLVILPLLPISLVSLLSFEIKITNSCVALRVIDLIGWMKKKGANQLISLGWDEIKGLRTNYFLYPESPIVILEPKESANTSKIEFMIIGMNLDVLRDIMTHLPSDVELNLYPYIEKRLNAEPRYTNKQIWIVAVLLLLMVVAGYLISAYLWK